MTLGENLQNLRKEKGLSQEEVARALFVTRQTISKWETDKAEPGVGNLKALADLYGVTLDQLTSHLQKERALECPKEQTPWERYRTMAHLRLALWGVMAAAGLMTAENGAALRVMAWWGILGTGMVLLSLRNPNLHVWGGILCGEALNVVAAVFCTILPERVTGAVISAGWAVLLCFWFKYLTSKQIRQLFEKER